MQKLLVGDKFMPEVHLKQPLFTYSARGTFTEDKERIQKFKETEDSSHTYQDELYKAVELLFLIKHYVTKHSKLQMIHNTMDIKEDLLQCFINFFIKDLPAERK